MAALLGAADGAGAAAPLAAAAAGTSTTPHPVYGTPVGDTAATAAALASAGAGVKRPGGSTKAGGKTIDGKQRRLNEFFTVSKQQRQRGSGSGSEE